MLAFTDVLGARDSHGEFMPFYVPRLQMPQIEDLPKLAWALLEKFNTIGLRQVPVTSVHRHQRVAMDKRQEAIMPDAELSKPIVVSADGFVIDGNHRHQAHMDKGLEFITALFVPMPFHAALDWLAVQDFVTHSAPLVAGKE